MRYCILFTFFPYSHFSFICGFVYAKANRAHTVCSGWESKESKEIALGDSAQWGGGACNAGKYPLYRVWGADCFGIGTETAERGLRPAGMSQKAFWTRTLELNLEDLSALEYAHMSPFWGSVPSFPMLTSFIATRRMTFYRKFRT